MSSSKEAFTMDGWNLGRFDDADWSPWGSGGNARAKILAQGDGYYAALVEASPDYVGDPHEHSHTEFLYVVDGWVRTQGETLRPGDAFVADAGSKHEQFDTPEGATYLSIFKV